MTTPSRRLNPGEAGGIVGGREAEELDDLTRLDPTVARGAELHGPATKADLLDELARGLGLPGWFGRNWDALEELLRDPEPPDDRAIVIVWHDPDRMPSDDGATARQVFGAAAAARQAAGKRPLVVVIRRSTRSESESMANRTRGVPESIRRMGRIHHVALIVRSIDDAVGLWRDQLGLPLETVMDIPQDRVRIAFLGVGESKVELVEPTDDTTGVARFLASKGEGFHHVCFEVAHLAEALLRLQFDGLELIDTAPRRGAEGPVAFIHPRSCHGVLVELIEAPGGPAWAALGY
ncbi:MAG TPA: methylmalonyl-CoA epimerase [Patescibacteria group bacterium]|nr:methylmalonyl-CoA epimerase [Patescibacteria group bacterium]